MANRTTQTVIKCACFGVTLLLALQSEAFATVFSVGSETTYNQTEWGADSSITTAQALLEINFNSVYASSFGTLVIGSTHTMTFDSASAIEDYLPQTGPAGVLTATLNDPVDSDSGGFGGDVLAVQLNVDFSDAGLIPASSGIPFGDLLFTGFGNSLDGLTVREFLGDANTCLGGGACLLSVDDMEATAAELNASFLDGPDAWADDHLTITVANVPEPISISLFGAGLGSAFAMRRRRKKNNSY